MSRSGEAGGGHHRQRIKLGIQVPARTEGGNQLADGGLFAGQFFIAAAACMAGEFGLRLHGGQYRGMRHVAGALEAAEIGLPLRGNGLRVKQELLVKFFDERGIAAGELRRFQELFNQTFHLTSLKLRFA